MELYLGVDLEWATASHTSIVEVGLGDGQGNHQFARLVRPEATNWGKHQMAIHGITPGMVAREADFGVVWTEAARWLQELGVDTLVAHKASAEAAYLTASIARYQVTSTPLVVHCTLRWVRALRQSKNRAWTAHLPPTDSLGALASELGLAPTSHRALADAQAAHRLAAWIVDLLDVASLSEVDEALQTEAYRLPARATWSHVQLVDVQCLSVGQLFLAASDHRRALRHGWPGWLVEDCWGSVDPPSLQLLDDLAADPHAHGFRKSATLVLANEPARTETRDVLLLGLTTSSKAEHHLHDLIVGDLNTLLRSAGTQVRGEAGLDSIRNARPDLLCSLPDPGPMEPWWPIEVDRWVAQTEKGAGRVREYFDRTRLEVDALDEFGIGHPAHSISWPGFASLVRCDVQSERSRPARAFVDVACEAPVHDLVHIAQGFLETDLARRHSEDRRERLLELRRPGIDRERDDETSAAIGRSAPPDTVLAIDSAAMRMQAVRPLVRDLVTVARLLRPTGPGVETYQTDLRWQEARTGKAVAVALDLDHRIIDGKRDSGERGTSSGPHAGGALRTDHATVFLTGTLGEDLGDPVTLIWGTYHRHILTLTVPSWVDGPSPTRQLRAAVVLRDSPHRIVGQRIWGRRVVVAVDGSLDDEIFGRDAFAHTATTHDRATIVLGWTGPIPAPGTSPDGTALH